MLIVDTPLWLIRAAALLFGALWGSFFNVAIYRWPREMSVVHPPSHCPGCKAPIPAYRNLPILAYLLQRGKAQCCGAKMSPRYLVIEILGAALALAMAERFICDRAGSTELLGASAEALVYFIFCGALLVATFIDLEHMLIPDEITLPGAALGLATATLRTTPGAADAAIGAGACYLFVQLILVWSYERLLGRRGMGEGDSKFLMLIGAFLGWQGGIFSLIAASFQGLIAAAIMLSTGKLKPTEDPYQDDDLQASAKLRIPFGPFLALGALEYLFFGPQIIEAYFSLLSVPAQ